MSMDQARTLKHELRTPVNHILGYVALLQETAEETGDTLLLHEVVQMRDLGNEINKAIERTLISSNAGIRTEDIGSLWETVSPLIAKIGERLTSSGNLELDDACSADMRRIGTATQRLQTLLQASTLPEGS